MDFITGLVWCIEYFQHDNKRNCEKSMIITKSLDVLIGTCTVCTHSVILDMSQNGRKTKQVHSGEDSFYSRFFFINNPVMLKIEGHKNPHKLELCVMF